MTPLVDELAEALAPIAELQDIAKQYHPLGYHLKLRWEKDPHGEHHITPRAICRAAAALSRYTSEQGRETK